MEHPCYKCGTMVGDGVPFCGHCRAPQIRVAMEPASRSPGPGESPEPSPSGGTVASAPFPKSAVQWSRALPMAALGGLLSILLLGVPLGAYGLAFLLGGAISVGFYERRSMGARLSSGMGARIGAASGGFGFLFLAITLVATSVYRADDLRKMLEEKIGELTARGYNPEQVKAALDLLKTPEGLAFFVTSLLMVLAFMYVAASAVGGALAARLLGRRLPR